MIDDIELIDVCVLQPSAALPAEMAAVLIGPQGVPGPDGPAVELVTTPPLSVSGGQITLARVPRGTVVWDMALVYVDLTPADFDTAGALLANRSYVVEEHLVRTLGSTVIFTDPPPHDGTYAVVSYLTAAV